MAEGDPPVRRRFRRNVKCLPVRGGCADFRGRNQFVHEAVLPPGAGDDLHGRGGHRHVSDFGVFRPRDRPGREVREGRVARRIDEMPVVGAQERDLLRLDELLVPGVVLRVVDAALEEERAAAVGGIDGLEAMQLRLGILDVVWSRVCRIDVRDLPRFGIDADAVERPGVVPAADGGDARAVRESAEDGGLDLSDPRVVTGADVEDRSVFVAQGEVVLVGAGARQRDGLEGVCHDPFDRAPHVVAAVAEEGIGVELPNEVLALPEPYAR